MPRSRIFGLYLLLVVVALGAGMLVARFLGTSPTLPSAYTTPLPAAPTAVVAASATAVPASVPAVVVSPASPTALSALPTATLELPLAPTATPAPTGLGYIEYTVQRGDILKAIATQHDTTIEEILAINQIPNPDSLEVASVIRIPTP